MSAPSPSDIAAVADADFGNKEAVTSVLFTPTQPVNPTQPDFVSEGKIIDSQAIAETTPFTSKSVRVAAKMSQSTTKSIYLQSDVAGTYVIQVLLDESELAGNPLAAVWRDYTPAGSPIAFTANVLSVQTLQDLCRQVRIVVTTSAASTITNAWVFSAP